MEDYYKYQQRLIGSFAVKTESKSYPSVFTWITKLLSTLGLRHFGSTTFYGLQLQVMHFQRQDQPIRALYLLIDRLESTIFWKNHVEKWWHLMRTAVNIAQDLQFSVQNPPQFEPLKRLIKLSTQGPQPWQGYDVAHSFAAFSLWSFSQRKTQKAMEQVNIAIHAFPSWGYAEYLLGWYGLMLEGIDPLPHFVKAIKMDWRYFQCIQQDPIAKDYPEIIEEIKKQILK